MKYENINEIQEILTTAKTLSQGLEDLTGGQCFLGGSLARTLKMKQWNEFNDVDLFVADIPDLTKAESVLLEKGWVPTDKDMEDYSQFKVLEKTREGMIYQAILSSDSLDIIVDRMYTSLSWFFHKFEETADDKLPWVEQRHHNTDLADQLLKSKMILVDFDMTSGSQKMRGKHYRMARSLDYRVFK